MYSIQHEVFIRSAFYNFCPHHKHIGPHLQVWIHPTRQIIQYLQWVKVWSWVVSYIALFHSGSGYFRRNIRISWKYPCSVDIICISWKYPRSVDIICILWKYPYFVDIICISWKYPRSIDIIHISWKYPHPFDINHILCIISALATLQATCLVFFVMFFTVLFRSWILFLVTLQAT